MGGFLSWFLAHLGNGTHFCKPFSVLTIMMHLLGCKCFRRAFKQLVEGRSFFHATIDLKLGGSCARSSACCEPFLKDRSTDSKFSVLTGFM